MGRAIANESCPLSESALIEDVGASRIAPDIAKTNFVGVPRVEYEKLNSAGNGERPSSVRERVIVSLRLQQPRFQGTELKANADMGPGEVWKHCQLGEAADALARAAMERLHLSACA